MALKCLHVHGWHPHHCTEFLQNSKATTNFMAKHNHSWVNFIRYILLVAELRSWRRHFKFLGLAKITSQSKLWSKSSPLIRSLTHWNVQSSFSTSRARNISQQTSQLERVSNNPRLFHSTRNTICSSHHLNFFSREAPITLGSCSVFTIIHPHFLVSFCRSTQKHCVMSRLILLPWHLWYWEQYTVCVCTSQMMLRYRTTTLSTHYFHSHSHTFP